MITLYVTFLLLLLAVDALVFAFIFDNPLFFTVSIVLLAGSVLSGYGVIKNKRSKSRVIEGWHIGEGIEITDPENPVKTTVVLPVKTLSLGFLGIGSPGSGKTVSAGVGYLSYLFSNDQSAGWSVLDGKGDIDFYLDLVRCGVMPDRFFSSELPGSDSINLLEGDPYDVVDRCLRFLVPTSVSTSFYSDEQRTTLHRIIPALKQLGMPVSMRDLYAILTVEEAAIDFMHLARQADIDESSLMMLNTWFNTDFEERLNQNKGMLNRLYVFVAGSATDRLNAYQPDISISEATEKGLKLFFHLPYSQFAIDVAIAIVEMFGIEARKRQLSGTDGYHPYPLLFEDYGGFFHDNFGPISSRCRSAKMPLNFTFQSLAQLQKVDETFKDEIDDNVQTKIAFRVMGRSTTRFVVDLLDEFETREVSMSEVGDRDGSNVQHIKQQRITSKMLKELSPGEAYISTLIHSEQGMVNPLYRVQFPAPDLDNGIPAALPSAKETHEGRGLGLWSKYMNPSKLADINQELYDSMQVNAEVSV
ncbi:MAG: hypothetical protein OQK73_00170 [Gammaproteobacteria bacterium]|nr:hypothetical protein [Gammaproteobacteria bacterium]